MNLIEGASFDFQVLYEFKDTYALALYLCINYASIYI